MELFARFGSWLDRGIERIFGKPTTKPEIVEIVEKPIWKIRKAVTEEARALWREERMPAWERKMRLAIEKHKEEGMEEEELVERYGEFV